MAERSSQSHATDRVRQEPGEPHLFLAFDGNYPKLPTARHRLGGVDEILIGRGRAREVSRERDGALAQLILRFPDPWMSTDHARLQKTDRGLIMTDPGSKNGSFVNGVRQSSAVLTDGDLLQFGHTFFVYRDALPVLAQEPADAISDLDAPPGLQTVLTPLAQSFQAFAQAAVTGGALVIIGERGAGKSLLAQSAHALSGRSGRFVTVLPAKMDPVRLEHRLRGTATTPGALAEAAGGTLLIDGLEALHPGVHDVIITMLRDQMMSVSGQGPAADCRVIVTSSQPLDVLARKRALDPAFEAALADSFHLTLPPLRQRREDLGVLVASMLMSYGHEGELVFSAEAAHALFCYAWPNNVRELEGCVGTALALRDGSTVALDHLPIELQRPLNAVQEIGSDTLDTIELTEKDLKRRAEIIAALRARSGDLLGNTDALVKARTKFQSWLARNKILGDRSDT